ncbi:MAG: 50S ribosomal protein L22 [Phycisphaerae bacterium]
MAWTARHRFARISPRKARLVADLIRGKDVNEALEILRFVNKRASMMVDKVLRSAIASADEQEANVSRLYVADARVDDGPMLWRWRPKDRGRAHPIRKRTSHIVVTVEQQSPDGAAGRRGD